MTSFATTNPPATLVPIATANHAPKIVHYEQLGIVRRPEGRPVSVSRFALSTSITKHDVQKSLHEERCGKIWSGTGAL